MITIIHKIRLKKNVSSQEFEKWVKETDYVTAPNFKSLLGFGVSKADVGKESNAAYHYFEIIHITSRADFEKDMQTPEFQSLVAKFTTMAEVVEEISGTFLEPGFRMNNLRVH